MDPSHALVTEDLGLRARISLLQAGFRPNMAKLLEDNGTVAPGNYRSFIQSINTVIVENYLTNRDRIKLLLQPYPSISSMDSAPSRHFHTTLKQIILGQCSRLDSIGISDMDLSPLCSSESHTTSHIFSCPAAPASAAFQ